jgi:hypothetical protein
MGNAFRPMKTIPIPEVYVLWHPQCELGEHLASQVYRWLRPGNGLGPEVFYRSLPAPEHGKGGLPPNLPGQGPAASGVRSGTPSRADLQVVLPLIDAHMIADASWRHWLSQLGSSQCGLRFCLPVALDATAYNAPRRIAEQNFLRPAGLEVPDEDVRKQTVTRSLLKQLTEALCRLMHGAGKAAAPSFDFRSAEKPKIFLSHAKADGTVSAKRIRDYIYSQTQIATFYDESDIPYGSNFGSVIERSVKSEAAGLIVVRSARYAERPWCRKELALFRRPFRVEPQQGPAQHWRLSPTLVVDALKGGEPTTGIAELGNAPVVRWGDDVVDQEEQIVTMVLRDLLLSSFHSALARNIPQAKNHIILNWLPDPTTLLAIPDIRSDKELKIFYPGRGLSGLELSMLTRWFSRADEECRLEFHSFEEALLSRELCPEGTPRLLTGGPSLPGAPS